MFNFINIYEKIMTENMPKNKDIPPILTTSFLCLFLSDG
tara:strand:- start:130 stop:246 length:117 start_codon:yes stop_codon:yes gene_type:complete